MFRLAAFALVLLIGLFSPAFTQTDIEKAIAMANDEVAQLYRKGKYAEGLELAQQTLERAEKELGLEHPATLTGMNNLAALYSRQGRY